MAASYYRVGEVCLLCFDMSDVSTFDRTQFWKKKVSDHNPKCLFILVGTKEDLLSEETLRSLDPISRWAEEEGIPYFPTSALKGGEHIRFLFHVVAEKCIRLKREKQLSDSAGLKLQSSIGQPKAGCCPWPKWRDAPKPEKVSLRNLERDAPAIPAAIRSDGFWTSRGALRPDDALEQRFAKTTQTSFGDIQVKMARLATPKEPGASERTQRRAVSREYAAYAKDAAAQLLPQVARSEENYDLWHTAGEDGYKSAIFHAATFPSC
eukprot:g16890.t1